MITVLTVVPLLVLRSGTRRKDRNQSADFYAGEHVPARSLEPVR